MACQKITWNCFGATDDNLYDSPIQGNQDDCALIAALSSVAWVTKKKKLNCSYAASNYTATFYAPGATNVTVTNDLDVQNAHSHLNEAWVGVYEKTYAKQFLGCGGSCCPIQLGAGKSWPGNACPPLQYLTGCNVVSLPPFPPAPHPQSFFNTITTYSTNNKTKYPTVIRTKDPIPTGPNDDKALRNRHEYSVLGYSGNYAILRDPFRALPNTNAANNPNCLVTGSYSFTNHFVASMCPGYNITPNPTRLTVTYGSNGIVGVHSSLINDSNWFVGMCYAKN